MGNKTNLPSATRRLFLRRSLLALGAIAAAPAMTTQAIAKTADSASALSSLSVLSQEEYRILTVVGDTVVPRGGAFNLGALDIDLATRIDSYLDPDDAPMLQGLRGALMFLEHKAPALAKMEGTFSALPAPQREGLLLALRDTGGDATAVYAALRGLCTFYFYTHEHAWPGVGYDGPLVKRGRPVYPQVEA
ncbi:gluconate 2-dehydrogenase subunit 3 family protein [Marinobacterium stanieri]|uniref:Gluconate 2-dehydrogenase subunit 3 n=1 Tax=Marinobacterium stanieri TaxID=49186 RepID=A0A1N6U445_9GAMM|nr:gluconate 2-dehydrogenase subunit 3 family protein [Marinobacterium stanieri]SIQ60307.1 Gluconate 2-dehydrogenase subunit 3 [Marinobacterium stanieri]